MISGLPPDVTHDQIFPPVVEKPKRIKQIFIAGQPYQINKYDTVIPKGFNKIHERAVYLLIELLKVYGWDVTKDKHIGITGLLDGESRAWRYDHDYDIFATKILEIGLKVILIIEVDGWNTAHPSEDQKLTPAVRDSKIKAQFENDRKAETMIQFYYNYILPKSQEKNDRGIDVIIIRPEKEKVLSCDTDEELIKYLQSIAFYHLIKYEQLRCNNLNIRANKAHFLSIV
jgi:hypothetical protein